MPTKTPKKPKYTYATLAAKLKEYGGLINKLRDDHEGLRAYTDKKNEWLLKQLVCTSQLDDLRQYVGKNFTDVEKTLKLLDDRQGDVANNSRAMSLNIEQHEKEIQALTNKTAVNYTSLDVNFRDVYRVLAEHKMRIDQLQNWLATKSENDTRDFDHINEKLTKEQVEAPKAPPEKTLKECLTAAKYLVSAGWCVGKLASRSNDEEVHSHDPSATRWSALGAIVRACDSKAPMDKAVEKLYEVVRFIWPTLPIPSASLREMRCLLDEWNDGMVKGKEDVLFAFDVAIRTADR